METSEYAMAPNSSSVARPVGDLSWGESFSGQKKPIHLGIGDLVIVTGGCPMVTVLGSCLALVIGAPSRGIYGMIHSIYPSRNLSNSGVAKSERLFVDEGFLALRREFEIREIPDSQFTFKLFGGASMLGSLLNFENFKSAGAANLTVARETLAKMGATLQAFDVGGINARKVHVNTETGEVSVRKLRTVTDPLLTLNEAIRTALVYNK